MARQVRPWLAKTSTGHSTFECDRAIGTQPAHSIRDSGSAAAKVRMYGRNLCLSYHHELFAWHTGGVHGVLRMQALRLREQCFIEDEGWPLEVGLQELTSNHLKLRGSRVRVVSVEEKAEINSVRCVLVRRTQVNH